MTPTLSVMLCLGLCLGQRMRVQTDRPSFSADKGPLVPLGSSVSFRCRVSRGAEKYLLGKEQELGRIKVIEEKPAGGEVEFLIPTVSKKDAGKYYCLYGHSYDWLEHSDPLKLVVTGVYDAPSLSAWPSSQVTPGQQVTLQCLSQERFSRFVLYKDGEPYSSSMAQPQGWGPQATFSLPARTPAQGGTYQCYSYRSDHPYVWSAPSDPLVLRLTGPGTTKKPQLTQTPGNLQTLVSSPPEISPAPRSGYSLFGILTGISTFLILLFLFLLLLLWHRRQQRQTRLRNGGREAEAKKTSRSSDPDRNPLEENLYADVGEDRHTEETRPSDPAASLGEGPQEVTYAQLNLNSLKIEVEDPPPSGSEDPSIYAALR